MSRSPAIAIGADHGGFALKELLKKSLQAKGYEVEDCGTLDGSRCDYPIIAASVAERVSDGRCPRGIIIDGAGIGSSMAANKLPGVRAALCYDLSSARNSREHNDANVLCLGGRLLAPEYALDLVDAWIGTAFEDRHSPRLSKITSLEATE